MQVILDKLARTPTSPHADESLLFHPPVDVESSAYLSTAICVVHGGDQVDEVKDIFRLTHDSPVQGRLIMVELSRIRRRVDSNLDRRRVDSNLDPSPSNAQKSPSKDLPFESKLAWQV